MRAADSDAAKDRLKNNLQKYALWDSAIASRIIPVVGDLAKPRLGLDADSFENLARTIETIYHSAAMLNYVYPYSAMKAANVLGTKVAIALCLRGADPFLANC